MLIPRAGSGLLEPFDPPGLALDDAIERNWQRRRGGRLLEPVPRDDYQPTYPAPWWLEVEADGSSWIVCKPACSCPCHWSSATIEHGPLQPARPVQALDPP